MKKIIALLLLALMIVGFCACDDSSSYSLHNKDGSINWEYYNDMQDYFEKNPDKRP